MTEKTTTASFGRQDVPIEEKQKRVHRVFESVADKYDVMNDLMSGGLHRVWKQHMVDSLAFPTGNRDFYLLDVAGGTGDIAFKAAAKAGDGFAATILDINEAMLQAGQTRLEKKKNIPRPENINFTVGNAEALALQDGFFDAYTIAFGIRNVTHRDKALAEAYRVLKPGGRFLCLEFSHVADPILEKLYDRWSFNIIPKVGKFIAGDEEAYQYLVESIRRFPKPDNFSREIEAAGFSHVRYERLSGGIVALHSAWRV